MAETMLLQRWALGMGLVITTLGIVRVGVLPLDAPMPTPLPPQLLEQLKAKGWQHSGDIVSQGRTQLSNTAGVVLRHTASPGSAALTLSLVPVRARGSQHLTIETINRELFGKTPKRPRSLRIGKDELLLFRNGRTQQAASCITSGEAKANAKSLDRAIAAAPAGEWQTRVKTMIGLEPLTNFSCLYSLLSIEAADRSSDQAFQQAWRKLGPVLTQKLQ